MSGTMLGRGGEGGKGGGGRHKFFFFLHAEYAAQQPRAFTCKGHGLTHSSSVHSDLGYPTVSRMLFGSMSHVSKCALRKMRVGYETVGMMR